ncbi:hypothetical protein [uncultured Arthrobacter sp.]|uniref:hypothetical protein n=1 Tax=uncultured Arthrobacter sp. TaxID=114050 RepID=UPI0028D0CC55|nr:hypothetical protein [uncultured Arthrobacter sp.]
MTWHPPVPRRVIDAAGTAWTVRRAWPGTSSGSYVLEVRSPDRPGVLAGHFSGGAFEAVTVDDSRLPALAAESARGEILVHRAHKRAVVRAPEAFIKVFRPGRALDAAASHSISGAALAEGGFNTPRLVSAGPDVLVLSRLAGRSFHELGHGHAGSSDQKSTGQSGMAGQAGIASQAGITDAAYAAMWSRWSRAWAGTVTAAGSSAFHDSLQQLPLRDAAKEATSLQRWVDHWLRHSEGIAEAAPARAALLSRVQGVTATLLSTPPDRLGWAHGDLHDKQILGGRGSPSKTAAGSAAPGLLDFDESCRAEVALDLANLDVHLGLRWRQKLLTTRRYAIAHAAVMSAAERLHVSPHRFSAYAASTRLRLACLYSFRPPWGADAASYLVSGYFPAQGPALPERTPIGA